MTTYIIVSLAIPALFAGIAYLSNYKKNKGSNDPYKWY